MKKTLCIILLIMCCASVAIAEETVDLTQMTNAELTVLYGDVLTEIGRRAAPTMENAGVTAEAPILFRSIPWGTSATSFVASMSEQGISGSISSSSWSQDSWEFKEDNGTIKSKDSLSDSGFTYNCYSPKTSVASFNISSIKASFLYTFDAEDIYTEENQSQLYKATYTFDVVDGKSAYTVLAGKLTSLYGKGQTGTTSTGWWSTGGNYHTYTDWTVWYGPNDTGVVLWHVYETYDSDNAIKADTVYLSYGKTNSLMTMSDLKAAMAREELEEAMNSTDMNGL